MIVKGKFRNIVTTKAAALKPQKLHRIINLDEFYDKRNKMLIVRSVGGLGDIFMHRMMFEDMRNALGGELHFACPVQYHEAVYDHPYIDKVIDSRSVDRSDYIISYNTSTACGNYEMKIAPFSDLHRSDIWSRHCGFDLTNHNMHIRLKDSERQRGQEIIEEHRNRPGKVVLLAPISAQLGKNLLESQMEEIVHYLRDRGVCVFGLHTQPIPALVKLDVPCIHSLTTREWMSTIDAADYVVSVDTAAFHCAGGLGKPLVGIFTFADGMIYGKYFKFVLVQKHRFTDPDWNCGPCYNWGSCPKSKVNPRPCLTEISGDMLRKGLTRMFEKWPLFSQNVSPVYSN